MKQRLVLLILVMVLLSGPSVLAEKIKLRTFMSIDASGTTISGKATYAVVEAFQKKFPHIEIETTQKMKLEGAGNDAMPLMAIAGGVSPDIIYVNFRLSHSYINRGFLYPLGEYYKELSEEEINERIHPQVKPVVYREGPDGKKNYWTMPYSTFVIVLLYRKDLFERVGLDPERPPKNWDEFIEYSRKIHGSGKGVYGVGLSREATVSWSWYSFLLSAGARAVTKDENGRWSASFEGDKAAESAYFYLRLLQEEHFKNGERFKGCGLSASYSVPWQQGRVGMIFNYLQDELITAVNPDLVGIAPVPVGPTGLRGSEINAMMMGMYAGIKDKKVRDAAWEFMKFWTGQEARRIRTKVFVTSGYAKFVNPEFLEKYGFKEYLEYVPKGWFEAYQAALDAGVPEPYGKNCGMIYRYMSDPLNKMRVEKLGTKPYGEVKDRIKELLHEAVVKTNERMIGEIPADVMKFRRIVAGAAALAIFTVFIVVFIYLMRAFTPEHEVGKGWQFRKYFFAYVLLIPAVGAIGLWKYVPLFRGALMAFQNYRVLQESTWVGLDNFAKILFDPEFWQALGTTLYYVGVMVGLGFFAPIVLAILLHEVPKGKLLFRTVYYLPAVVSGLVVMFMWRQFYDQSKDGLLNQLYLSFNMWPIWLVVLVKITFWLLLALVLYNSTRFFIRARSHEGGVRVLAFVVAPALWLLLAYSVYSYLSGYVATDGENAIFAMFGGIKTWTFSGWGTEAQGWLQDPRQAMVCVVVPTVWAGMGPGCLLYLAALKTVSEEVYEAADLDGAGTLQKIRHITIPTIKPLIIINLVGYTVRAFQTSGYILAMTGGGPGRATNVLGLEIFFNAFAYMEFGIATAMAWVLSFLLIGFTAYQMKRLSRMQFKAAGSFDK